MMKVIRSISAPIRWLIFLESVVACLVVWLALDWRLVDDLRGAAIGALATVGAGTAGAMLVVWQIGRQAALARDQARDAEKLKLQVEIYKSALPHAQEVNAAVSDFNAFLSRVESGIENHGRLVAMGITPAPPQQRVTDLHDLMARLGDAALSLIVASENWEIVDLRLKLIRSAMHAALHDAWEAYHPYHDCCLRVLPIVMTNGAVAPWTLPSEPTMRELRDTAKAIELSIHQIGNFSDDIRVALQNLLLGELFPHQVPARTPMDPRSVVVDLHRHAELERYFWEETGWGRAGQRAEANVRAALSEHGMFLAPDQTFNAPRNR